MSSCSDLGRPLDHPSQANTDEIERRDGATEQQHRDRVRRGGQHSPGQGGGHHHKTPGHKHAKIQEGEKIKYVYLKTPNPINENVMAYMGKIPDEFGIQKYIDYNTQFEKAFFEPLKKCLDAIGWKSQQTMSLMSFIK